MRKAIAGAAAALTLVGATGCSATGSSSVNPNNASYWLVRVDGTDGNIYAYTQGSGKPTSTKAANLGSNASGAVARAKAVAPSLGITHVNTEIVK